MCYFPMKLHADTGPLTEHNILPDMVENAVMQLPTSPSSVGVGATHSQGICRYMLISAYVSFVLGS